MFPYDNQNIDSDLLKRMLPQNNQPVEEHTLRVCGRNGANAVNLAPNSDKLALDQNDPIVWFIQTDGAGYKTVVGYDINLHKEVRPEDMMKSFDERLTRLEEVIRNGKSYNPANGPKPKSGCTGNDAGSRSNAQG